MSEEIPAPGAAAPARDPSERAEHLRPWRWKRGFDPRRLAPTSIAEQSVKSRFLALGKKPIPEKLRLALTKAFPDLPPEVSYLDAVIAVTFEQALLGQPWATELIMTRVYGKPREHLELSPAAAAPLVIFPERAEEEEPENPLALPEGSGEEKGGGGAVPHE